MSKGSHVVVIWVTSETGHRVMFSELKPRHEADQTDMAEVAKVVASCIRASFDLAKVDGWAAHLSPETRGAIGRTESWVIGEIEAALVERGLVVDW